MSIPTRPKPRTWKLFLDDLRAAPSECWVTARDVAEAQALIMARGMPAQASFDHDLGDGPSGYALARWMVEQDLGGEHPLPDGFMFTVHSRNPVGSTNIKSLLTGYLAFRKRD